MGSFAAACFGFVWGRFMVIAADQGQGAGLNDAIMIVQSIIAQLALMSSDRSSSARPPYSPTADPFLATVVESVGKRGSGRISLQGLEIR